MQKLRLVLILAGSLLTFLAQAQSRKIAGRVISATDKSALPGVTVLLKGTTIGSSTDMDGRFELEFQAIANPVLVVSFVGFESTEIPVGNNSTFDVALAEKHTALSDVVVVGYGTQKRSDITGAIVSIDEKAIREVPAANLAQALQGQGAGIDVQKSGGNSHPGATPTIQIRGTRSVNASNNPLFVVDGIPFNGSINDLNQDDVLSVEVLKDASSTAIYGSRGANGVILITTKHGRVGKPVVNYSGYAGVTKPLGEYPVMNAEQFTNLKKWALINGNPGKYTGLDDPTFLTNGSFAPQEVASINSGRSTDWQKLIYKDGIMTNHQLSVSGGTDNTQYAFSGGYYNETGIYFGQAFKRYTAKISVDQQLGKRFKVGLNSLNNLSYTDGENANPLGQALRASPLATPYNDADGSLVNGFVQGSANQVWNPLANFVPNAVAETRKRMGTFTTLYLDATLAEGLKYRLNGGAEIKPETYGNFYASGTTNNLGGASSARNQNTYNYSYTLENILTYDKTIATSHHFNFTGLYSLQEFENQVNTFNYDNVLADYLQYYNPAYSSNLNGSGSYQKWDIISYMGRLNYGFKDRYLLTLTMRSDGSSRLAPGNKYHVFPSAAVAWNVINEPFLSSKALFTNLKLRLSYGTVGNTAVDPYKTLGAFSPLNYNYGSTVVTGAYPTDVANPNLTWEYTSTLNAGLDFGLLQNRITGSFEAYHAYTNSLLLFQTLPQTTGIENKLLSNIGKTENMGLELTLNTVNIQPKAKNGFGWTTNLNIFVNRGKVTQLASGVSQDISNNLFVGQPIGSIFDYQKVGIWQNTPADIDAAKALGLTVTGTGSVIGTIRVADLNGDGKLNALDRTIIGTPQPDFEGGMTNRLSYKGLDFSVLAAFRVGGTITSNMFTSGSFINTYQGNYNNINVDYWTPFNNQNDYPKPNSAQTNTQYSSLLSRFDGTYLKIRTISLGYNLPVALAGKIGMGAVRLYSTVQNRFIFFSSYRDKYHGIDPETAGTLSVNTPATWSTVFGLNLTLK